MTEHAPPPDAPLNARGKPMLPNSPRPVPFFDPTMPFLAPDAPVITEPAPGQPTLSLLVVIYNMREQALKTLLSLSPSYQRGVDESDYEVIVVENASGSNLEEHEVTAFGKNFRYFRRQETEPTPVHAANFAASQARGLMFGLIIDGARMATPGLVSWSLVARKLHPHVVVCTPGYHLGPKLQQESMLEGYDSHAEQQLLDGIGWPHDGYRLFEIAVFSGTSAGGLFKPISESNCLCIPRETWQKLGGCDIRFNEIGGGQVNLDIYKRACELPESMIVVLPGERNLPPVPWRHHHRHPGRRAGSHHDGAFCTVHGTPWPTLQPAIETLPVPGRDTGLRATVCPALGRACPAAARRTPGPPPQARTTCPTGQHRDRQLTHPSATTQAG